MEPKHSETRIVEGIERRETVLRLRAEGWTFKRIAAELGVSPSRAAQLHARAVQLHRPGLLVAASSATPDTLIDRLTLSLRTVAALKNGGYTTLAQMMPLDDSMERRLLLLPNFGRPCLNEVRAIMAAMEKQSG